MANISEGLNKYAHFRSDSELRAGVLMWVIVSPILLLVGTVGNILSIIVLSRSKLNKTSSSSYLTALAVGDLAMLYIGLLRQWIRYLTGVDLRLTSGVMCKIHWWLMYVTADCSVWLLTTITIERVISSICPFKAKILCTQKRAKIVIGFVVCLALLVNCHLLFGMGSLIVSTGNVTATIPCAPLSNGYDNFFGLTWSWIDLCKYSIVPFVILTLGNVCIIMKLVSSRKKTANGVALAGQRVVKPSSMSTILVVLNFVFIICTAPVCIYFIGSPYWIPEGIPREIQLQDPAWAFVNIMMYINNAINFFLYFVSGSRFRAELRILFRCNRNTVHPSCTGNGTQVSAIASRVPTI